MLSNFHRLPLLLSATSLLLSAYQCNKIEHIEIIYLLRPMSQAHNQCYHSVYRGRGANWPCSAYYVIEIIEVAAIEPRKQATIINLIRNFENFRKSRSFRNFKTLSHEFSIHDISIYPSLILRCVCQVDDLRASVARHRAILNITHRDYKE